MTEPTMTRAVNMPSIAWIRLATYAQRRPTSALRELLRRIWSDE